MVKEIRIKRNVTTWKRISNVGKKYSSFFHFLFLFFFLLSFSLLLIFFFFSPNDPLPLKLSKSAPTHNPPSPTVFFVLHSQTLGNLWAIHFSHSLFLVVQPLKNVAFLHFSGGDGGQRRPAVEENVSLAFLVVLQAIFLFSTSFSLFFLSFLLFWVGQP